MGWLPSGEGGNHPIFYAAAWLDFTPPLTGALANGNLTGIEQTLEALSDDSLRNDFVFVSRGGGLASIIVVDRDAQCTAHYPTW